MVPPGFEPTDPKMLPCDRPEPLLPRPRQHVLNSAVWIDVISQFFCLKILKGRHKKAQALRRPLLGWNHAQYNCAWCPGCRMVPKCILTKLGDIFQKFTNRKNFRRSNSGFLPMTKNFFGNFFLLKLIKYVLIRP